MAQNIFFELSIVVAAATLVSIFMKIIKQPLIIGYIITGIVLGPFALNLVQPSDTLVTFSEIGIAFLLFIVGLNLNFKTLKDVGVIALITGIAQVAITFVAVYFISKFLGFSGISSLYISGALAFSSTIIVVKLLLDKHDLDTLYGKIAVGLLLVQDFIVIVLLLFLSPSVGIQSFSSLALSTIIKMAVAIALVMLAGNYFVPKVLEFTAKSQELLFLFGISWVLLLASSLSRLGFSIEMGALFAGIGLASSPFSLEIGNKLKPLRDFFIILFFISLGSQMIFILTAGTILKIIVLSLAVLVLKPIIVMSVIGLMGYKKRIGFLAGISLAQVSEFSFILIILAVNLGQISQETASLVTLVGLITIAGSSYMILNNYSLYQKFSNYLSIFEKNKSGIVKESAKHGEFKIILFGYNRIGFSLLKSFRKLRKKFLIVDYNPETIEMLTSHKIGCKYGDASDPELIEEIGLQSTELVISTIPQIDVNLLLVEKIRAVNKKAVVVMTSHNIDDAFNLYEAGVDYVLMPHFLGGDHASALIEKFGTDINKFVKEKLKHIEELNQRKDFGHEHPTHNL